MKKTFALLVALTVVPLTVLAAPKPSPRYRDANARLGKPKPGEKRVVFFGSSSVEGWKLKTEFPNRRSFVNRGISGQNTRQMLARFDQDVVGLQPKVVVIHIGAANDIGVVPRKETIANLRTMIRRSRKHGIVPILLSPTPSRGGNLKARPIVKVKALREEMRKLARSEDVRWVDVFPLVAAADGRLRKDLTKDGLHLNAKGYRLLRVPVLRAIDRSLIRG